eukprot:1196116-Pleurochrysis_carterae.AAC.1
MRAKKKWRHRGEGKAQARDNLDIKARKQCKVMPQPWQLLKESARVRSFTITARQASCDAGQGQTIIKSLRSLTHHSETSTLRYGPRAKHRENA